MGRSRLLGAAALLVFASDGAAGFRSPRFTRDQMEARLDASDPWLFVHGTAVSASSAALCERALAATRLLAGNGVAALSGRGGGLALGGDDWRITRAGELTRSGSFAQSADRPWRYEAALDRDLEREREGFAARLAPSAGPGLVVRAADEAAAASARARGRGVLDRLDRMGIVAGAADSIELTLYRSLEEKGVLARNTRPEHLDERGRPHAARAAGRDSLDLWSVAAARLRSWSGSGRSRFVEPAASWIAGRLEGEPLETAIRRLRRALLLPTAREAATAGGAWRSPLIWNPARALLARAVYESAGGGGPTALRALRALLEDDPPGSLDSLCRRAAVDPTRVAGRYASLADSLARTRGGRRVGAPRPWRPSDGFQRGVCLAHAVDLERGYLSESCRRELAGLARMGADWVSLTPFGYLPSPATPEIHPSAAGGIHGESDEAVAEAAARARDLGLKVWLKPHLWTRGWAGELEFGPRGWPRFFEQYRRFLLHYALLAEREGMEGLVVGHELPTATIRFPDRWRALIAEVRRVYRGTLTYGAHWDEEVEALGFWDALDVVGVSLYAPLVREAGASGASLETGASLVLARLRGVAARAGRPALLVEVGFAPHAGAPLEPWTERGGPVDLEAQRACYAAMVRAIGSADWVAGVFWWKWFTTDRVGGPLDGSFSPRGKPAEAIMTDAFREWRRRPVRVPGG